MSHSLVYYPTDAEQFQLVNREELMAIQELDEDEAATDPDNHRPEGGKVPRANTFDLTASQFPDLSELDNPPFKA